VESSKKVQQLQSKQKQPGNTTLAGQSATSSRAIEKKSSTALVSSAGESAQATGKPGSVGNFSLKKSSAAVPKESAIVNRSNASAVSSTTQNKHVKSQSDTVDDKKSSETTAMSSAAANGSADGMPVVNVVASCNSASSAELPNANRRLSDVNEPTKQPVAARLAAWKKKTTAVENASTLSQHSASRDKLHTISETTGVHKIVLNEKDRGAELKTKPSSGATSCKGKLADSVRIASSMPDDGGKTSFPPLKDGEVRHRTLPSKRPPTKPETAQTSWKKLGPATLEIQQKLTAMCENWKQNEIAEKSRKERAVDMMVLENRWQNGILAEDQKEVVAAAVDVPPAESDMTQVY